MSGLQYTPVGTSFPAGTVGSLFFRTDELKLYGFDGFNWRQLGLLDTSSNLIIAGKYLKE